MPLKFNTYTDGEQRAIVLIRHVIDFCVLVAAAAMLLDGGEGEVEERPTPTRADIEREAKELLTNKGRDWLIGWQESLTENDADEVETRAVEVVRTLYKELA